MSVVMGGQGTPGDPLAKEIGFRHWRLGVRLDDYDASVAKLRGEIEALQGMQYHIMVDGYLGKPDGTWDTSGTVRLIKDLAERFPGAFCIECWNEVHDAGVSGMDKPWWKDGVFDATAYMYVLQAIKNASLKLPICNSASVNYWQVEGSKYTGKFLDLGMCRVVDYFNLHCYLPSYAWNMKGGDKDVFTAMNGYADKVVDRLGSCDGRFRKGSFWERMSHKAVCTAYRARALQWGLWFNHRITKPVIITEYGLSPLTESEVELRNITGFFEWLFKPQLMMHYTLDHLKYEHIRIDKKWW